MSGSSVIEYLVPNLEKVLEEHKQAMKVWDVEDAVASCIDFYKLIINIDERQHERAIEDTSYPFQEEQGKLKEVMKKFIKTTDKLLGVCETFEKRGYEIRDKDKLKAVRDAFINTDKLFESFYASNEFKEVCKKAVEEHRAGKTEDWPE